jgi:hypothetical protein
MTNLIKLLKMFERFKTIFRVVFMSNSGFQEVFNE